jgi:hypothetical protein
MLKKVALLTRPAQRAKTAFSHAAFLPSSESQRIGDLTGLSVRQELCEGRTGRTKCGVYLLASSLAAALNGARRVSARQGRAGEKSGHF